MKREAGELPENTSPEERTLISQRLHWGVFIWPAIITVLLILPLIAELLFVRVVLGFLGLPGLPMFVWLPTILVVLPGLAWFWAAWIAYEDTEYFLTPKRLAFRTGWLLTAKGELPLQNVEAVFLVEPMLGRLLGYGTVVVTGTGGTWFPLRFMPDPHLFHLRLQQALEALRSGKPLRLPPDAAVGSGPPRPASPPKSAGDPTQSAPPRPDAYGEKTPLEKAWEELHTPPLGGPEDDSCFHPKS